MPHENTSVRADWTELNWLSLIEYLIQSSGWCKSFDHLIIGKIKPCIHLIWLILSGWNIFSLCKHEPSGCMLTWWVSIIYNIIIYALLSLLHRWEEQEPPNFCFCYTVRFWFTLLFTVVIFCRVVVRPTLHISRVEFRFLKIYLLDLFIQC